MTEKLREMFINFSDNCWNKYDKWWEETKPIKLVPAIILFSILALISYRFTYIRPLFSFAFAIFTAIALALLLISFRLSSYQEEEKIRTANEAEKEIRKKQLQEYINETFLESRTVKLIEDSYLEKSMKENTFLFNDTTPYLLLCALQNSNSFSFSAVTNENLILVTMHIKNSSEEYHLVFNDFDLFLKYFKLTDG